MGFFKKLKTELPCDPLILLLGIYQKECKSEYNTDTCTPVFVATLLTTAKLQKQPRYPTTDEWIKNMHMCVCVKYIKWSFIQPQGRMTLLI
jgi:hypothetical protein